MCALLMYLFRKISPKKLVIIAVILLAIPSAIMLMGGLSMPHWPPEAVEEMRKGWLPGEEAVQEELDTFRGGWMDQMSMRVPFTFKMHTFIFGVFAIWRVSGLMLLGMALYKWGVITAQRSSKLYAGLMALGLAIGLPLVIVGVQQDLAHNFSLEYSKFLGHGFNYWGGILVSLGYVGLVMLICRGAGAGSALLRPLASVGRMAFTNYIMQTLICTTIFYGHGFGLIGHLERREQILVVLAIWIFQLIVSPIWLKYFHFGPLEWAWRSLSYGKRQPMRVG
jgi:uncharacterized protein